jgi:hypothetical protein
MIEQYTKKVTNLKSNNPDSPLLLKMTPLSVGQEYKAICFSLINNLKMAHHMPGDNVILQNDMVLDEDG